VRDLELRGAGNLLGSQQSGHIAAIGFTLYCQLLKRTIARLKGEKVKEVVDVKLNLPFADPRIPFDYVEDEMQRMSLMRRFAEAQDRRAVRDLVAEMKDRYGPLPPAADEFAKVADLRVRCALAGVARIDTKDSRALLYRAGTGGICGVVDLPDGGAVRKLAALARAVGSGTQGALDGRARI